MNLAHPPRSCSFDREQPLAFIAEVKSRLVNTAYYRLLLAYHCVSAQTKITMQHPKEGHSMVVPVSSFVIADFVTVFCFRVLSCLLLEAHERRVSCTWWLWNYLHRHVMLCGQKTKTNMSASIIDDASVRSIRLPIFSWTGLHYNALRIIVKSNKVR